MSIGNLVSGGLGAFIQTRLMKKDKERREKMDSIVERLADLNSGVKKSEVTVGMPNTTNIDNTPNTSSEYKKAQPPSNYQPDVIEDGQSYWYSDASKKSNGTNTSFFAHGGTVGYYHGGMGGVPDRMSWQKENFKK
tara:strand:+ start:210 stop:617 length:408 start_codon:yes stop_codon:yes gene_type:complete